MAYFFGYLVLTIYFGCIAILPLLIYFFLEYLDGKKSFIPFVLTSALYIYINYHMGFMLVIFLVLFYLSRVIADSSYKEKMGGFIYCGVTVLMMDGFFLIRTGLSLIGEKTMDTADYSLHRNFAMNQVFANLFSGSTRNQYMPLMYCSVAALFFAVIYFASGAYSLREKLANGGLLAVILVSLWINTFDAVWHGFNNPEEFYFRYAYYVSFILVVLGYKGFLAFIREETSAKHWILRVVAVLVLIALYMVWLKFSGNLYVDRERKIVNSGITVIIAISALLICFGKKWRMAGFILLAAVSIPDMLYDAKTTYLAMNSDDGVLPTIAHFTEDYSRIGDAVGYVKSADNGFYRLEKDFDRAVNDPAMFDYIGLSHDSSCEKDAINRYLTNYGFRETVYYTFYNGGSTSFADAFLGVKYLISYHHEIKKPYENIGEAGDYRIFKNNYAQPMAYIAPTGLQSFTFGEENTFEKQNKLAALWGEGDPVYKKAESEYSLIGASEPESGHFVRTEDEGYIVYNIDITENMPLYYYFAAPHMQSGEVFVNGESKGWYFTENRWNVLCAGKYDVGDKVEIRRQILKEDLDITEACFYYEDEAALKAWHEKAAGLNEGISEAEEITSSHLSFETENDEEQLAVISMPYDDAWKIRCDGSEIKPVPVAEQLMGMRLPAGTHTIDMKYIPHGTFAGALVSLCGIALFAVGVFQTRRKKDI